MKQATHTIPASLTIQQFLDRPIVLARTNVNIRAVSLCFSFFVGNVFEISALAWWRVFCLASHLEHSPWRETELPVENGWDGCRVPRRKEQSQSLHVLTSHVRLCVCVCVDTWNIQDPVTPFQRFRHSLVKLHT